jgi:hypothetical protein
MSDSEIEILKRVLLFGKLLFYSFDKEDWQRVTRIGSLRSSSVGPVVILMKLIAQIILTMKEVGMMLGIHIV